MRTFANSLILPFQGATSVQPITAHKKSDLPPLGVSLDINWRAYALQMAIGGGVTIFNGAVSFDLSRGTVSNPLDIVKSVFIDNTNVDRPVYLQSVDTGQVVTCADGSYGWFPLLTFGESFVLYTDNIIPLRDNNQKTKIIFSNVSFDTFSSGELNRAQSLFRASGSSQYVSPVIADNVYLNTITIPYASLSAGNAYVPILPALANSQLLISAFIMTLKFYNNVASTASVISFGFSSGFNPDLITKSIRPPSGTASIMEGIEIINVDGLQLTVPGTADLNFHINFTAPSNTDPTAFRGDVTIKYARLTLPALSA